MKMEKEKQAASPNPSAEQPSPTRKTRRKNTETTGDNSKLSSLSANKVLPLASDLKEAGSALPIIRKAVKEDCKRLMELIYELAVYEKAPNEITVSLHHFEESGFGLNPVWRAFVAEVEGVIQGFALYYIRYSTWKGQRMYLEDILVNENFRRKNIGKLLFDRLIVEARENNFSGIVWQVLDWNEAAINFYKKYEDVTIDKGWFNCSLNFT
jgi:GNAT superfamily N-acetyltransferase